MARMRLGVALLVPDPVAGEVDGLRRACGDGALRRVVPHLTLVPPVNVRVDDLPAALAVLRSAAAATRPFEVALGPPTTFLPDTATLYLPIADDDGAGRAAVHRLRDAVFRGPLERPLTWPFVPHVTLADDGTEERLAAAVLALADYRVTVRFEAVHLLLEARHGESHRRWSPVADLPFRPPSVVGRGGVELELAVTALVDPEADALEEAAWAEVEDTPPGDRVPPGARSVVVTARRRGRVVGVGRGWARPGLGEDDGEGEVVCVTVAAQERRQGIARQVHLALESAIADAGRPGG